MVMAVSGLLLILFLITHMVGNLQAFGGPDLINAYGHKLRTVPGLLIVARVDLRFMLTCERSAVPYECSVVHRVL